MADITLVVGVTPDVSYDNFKKEIESLYNQLNGQSLKIKIDTSDSLSKIAKLQAQISSLYASINTGASGGTVSSSTASYAQGITSSAKAAQTAMQGLTEATRQHTSAQQTAASVSQQAAQASAQRTTQTKAEKDAAKQAAQAEKERAAQIRASQSAERSYGTVMNQARSALEKYTAATTSHKETSRIAYSTIEQESRALEALHIQYQSGAISTKEFSAAVASARTNIASATEIIRANGNATKSLGDKISNLASKFTSWLSISQVIMLVLQAMKKMVTSSIELDTAMTELRKVTNATDETYSKFLENASDRATKLGASLADVVSATADFARLGYDIDAASDLADAAIAYKNVGDDIDSISDASESIIATMQAFGIEASEAMTIVDKFNEVGNSYAISSGGIGEALLRSAASMEAAGNTLDETIALITAANTIVQDPESVGTTLKTVSMYLRAAKTEAEAAGESTDGMADSVSELREELLSLTGGAVDIQLDDSTFKGTFEILQELSEVWDNLSDISQANITELIGGKRNANVVSALLENFDIAEAALETSANSAGSALAENEKYLDSVQGKIDVMKASFQTLSSDFASSDFLKGAVSTLTSLLNLVDLLVSKVGALPTLLGAISSALSLSKNIGRDRMSSLL